MDITNTTNSALSLYVSLDKSYISRLRSGKRQLPRNKDSVKLMAAYFARNCRDEYRKKALGDIIGINPLPQENPALTEAIADWLQPPKLNDRNADTVEQFLGGLTGMKIGAFSDTSQNNISHFPNQETVIYYGVQGRRQAVLCILSELATLNKPQTLLLFSDEETSWMTDDPFFLQQLADLMIQTLSKGHRITIIHTISRDLDEMLNAIALWMPLYMAGTVEPYFYPKMRDGVFKRTMFVASGKAALVSCSPGGQTPAENVNILIRSPKAVALYEMEFMNYLSLCRPLMHIYNLKNRQACLQKLAKFEQEICSTIIETRSLSLMTISNSLLFKILSHNGVECPKILEFNAMRVESFQQLLSTYTYTEIISLPEPQDLICGKVRVALTGMLNDCTVFYTPEEYLLHLQNIIQVMEKHENYHVHLKRKATEDQYLVYVKENLGVIVAKTSLPPVVMALDEGYMAAAFWDYLIEKIGRKAYSSPNNKNIIIQIREYIQEVIQLLTP